MCVIMVANSVRPTEEMINKAFEHNKDGAGIAWREPAEDGVGEEVVWEKGLKLEEVRDLCAKVPTPYVVHFRVASIGGVKPTLTHPFLIGAEASTALSGRTKGAVLFHNGHWQAWADKALDAAITSNTKIPTGDWSDTRAMAYMAHIFGHGFMEFLPTQRGVIFSPDNLEVFTGNGWEKINGVWCSNDLFWSRRYTSGTTHYSGRLCTRGRCTEKCQVGKDLCVKCEQSDKDKAASKTEDKEDHTGGNESLVSAAGTNNTDNKVEEKKPGTLGLLVGSTRNGPLADILTREDLALLRRHNQISKSMEKKFKKQLADLEMGGNRAARAKAKLTRLSEKVVENLLSGSEP